MGDHIMIEKQKVEWYCLLLFLMVGGYGPHSVDEINSVRWREFWNDEALSFWCKRSQWWDEEKSGVDSGQWTTTMVRRCESRVTVRQCESAVYDQFLFWKFCGLNSWNRNVFSKSIRCGRGGRWLFRPFTINGPNGIFKNSLGFMKLNSYK